MLTVKPPTPKELATALNIIGRRDSCAAWHADQLRQLGFDVKLAESEPPKGDGETMFIKLMDHARWLHDHGPGAICAAVLDGDELGDEPDFGDDPMESIDELGSHVCESRTDICNRLFQRGFLKWADQNNPILTPRARAKLGASVFYLTTKFRLNATIKALGLTPNSGPTTI